MEQHFWTAFQGGIAISRPSGRHVHRSLLAGLGALALLVAGLVGVFVYAGMKQDEKAGMRERLALLAALHAHEELIQQAMATSEDERQVLGQLASGDIARLHERFGRRLNDGFGLEFVYIIDAKGNLLYSSENGKTGEQKAFAWIRPAITRALAEGRAGRAGLVASKDGAGILVVRPFSERADDIQAPQPLAAVTVDLLDDSLLQSLAAPAHLHDVQLRTGRTATNHPDRVGTAVPNLFDGTEAELAWRGAQPGRSLLRNALPALAVLTTLLSVTFLVMMFRALRVAAALAASEAQAREMASRDYLTGLFNRGYFIEALESALAGRAPDARLVLLFIDLDDFKLINDTAGHGAGDLLLKAVATRVALTIGDRGVVGRFGGDEFVAFFPAANAGEIDVLLDRLQAALRPPVPDGAGELRVSASIGVAEAPQDAATASDLMRRADIALYRAKDSGGDTLCRFETQLESERNARREIETALGGALERGELVITYQPQVDVASGRVVGFETLLRWDHPKLGRLLPAQFIAMAEEMHIIGGLDLYGLRRACMEAAALPGMSISVNIAPSTMRSADFAQQIGAILKETGFDPARLEIEVPETIVLNSSAELSRTFEALREQGVGVALDDYGTGYASLHHVSRFPVTRIKIDRSFMVKACSDPDVAAVIEHKLKLAQSLRINVTAEGVETREQLRFLREIGMPTAQGYLFAPPLPIAAAIDMLRRQDEALPDGMLRAKAGGAG
ncbi:MULTISPECIES: putative bifunctional diguanylate cyclase/phosphodiesterase [Xanthobacter]|uniref:putative bifunctional diguanylate cyclase/phosphodiesterase n=1 Tax=Xanthobacter TaxID=279 RepID=UPI0035B43653